TWTGAIQFQIPLACLEGSSCSDLDVAIGVLVDPSNGFVAAGCSGTSTCACTVTLGGSSSEAGTYTTSGTTIETTTSDGMVSDTPYCVSGFALHLEAVSATGAVTSDVVLAGS